MKKLTLIFLIAAASVVAVPFALAQDSRTTNEFDPGVGVDIDLTKVVRMSFFGGREKSEETGSTKFKASAAISVRLKPIFKGLMQDIDSDKQHIVVIGAGYERSYTKSPGGSSNENKLMLDGTGRWAFAERLLISDRSRFEFRWIDGVNSFRYRNRLSIERSVKVKKLSITPYVMAEAYWDDRYDKWNRFEYTGGVQFQIHRRASLDTFFQRVHCVTCSEPNTNIYGLTLNFYLRRKR